MTLLDGSERAVLPGTVQLEPVQPVASPQAAPAGRGARSLRALLLTADLAAVLVAWVAFEALGPGAPAPTWLAATAAAGAAAVGALALAGLYRSRVSSVRAIELARLPRVALASTVVGCLVLSRLGAHVSLPAAAGTALVAVLGLLVSRNSFDAYLRHCRRRGRHCRPLLLVGDGAEAVELGELVGRHPELGFRIVACDDGTDDDDVVRHAVAVGANGVLLTASAMSEVDRTRLINRLLDGGFHVHLSAGLRGLDPRRLRVVPLAHEPLFYVEPSRLAPWQLGVKRAFDIVAAAVLLVVTAPLVVAAAVAIKRYDGGPVLFRQERVGRDGRPFTCLKLRTMRVGAEREQDQVANARTGPLFKAAHDPRITPVGRFLRQSSIDELPQLVNVLRGDMSLVGPRPAIASEVAEFDPQLLRRLDVTPGMTGLWQVEARDVPDFDAYRRLDLHYVDNWRLSLDLVLLVLTAQVVISRLVAAVAGRPDGGDVDLAQPATLD